MPKFFIVPENKKSAIDLFNSKNQHKKVNVVKTKDGKDVIPANMLDDPENWQDVIETLTGSQLVDLTTNDFPVDESIKINL